MSAPLSHELPNLATISSLFQVLTGELLHARFAAELFLRLCCPSQAEVRTWGFGPGPAGLGVLAGGQWPRCRGGEQHEGARWWLQGRGETGEAGGPVSPEQGPAGVWPFPSAPAWAAASHGASAASACRSEHAPMLSHKGFSLIYLQSVSL